VCPVPLATHHYLAVAVQLLLPPVMMMPLRCQLYTRRVSYRRCAIMCQDVEWMPSTDGRKERMKE
jgi:hypothetical protein